MSKEVDALKLASKLAREAMKPYDHIFVGKTPQTKQNAAIKPVQGNKGKSK